MRPPLDQEFPGWIFAAADVLACEAGAVRTPNYEASEPRRAGRLWDSTMEATDVVKETLAALGRRPYVIPGRTNRVASFIMRHLLPRRLAVQLMGGILRDLYSNRN